MNDWKLLAVIDSCLTSELVDRDGSVSHKVALTPDDTMDVRELNLFHVMRNSYLQCSKTVDLRPVATMFSGDASMGHSSFGAFAKVRLLAGSLIPGLLGFLGELPNSEHERELCKFSKYEARNNKEIFMIGPLSFINSSCIPNAEFVPNVRQGVVRVKLLREILPNEEILVRYGGTYFGADRKDCECPHQQFHGGSTPTIINGKTRSQAKQLVQYPQSEALLLKEVSIAAQVTNRSSEVFQQREALVTDAAESTDEVNQLPSDAVSLIVSPTDVINTVAYDVQEESETVVLVQSEQGELENRQPLRSISTSSSGIFPRISKTVPYVQRRMKRKRVTVPYTRPGAAKFSYSSSDEETSAFSDDEIDQDETHTVFEVDADIAHGSRMRCSTPVRNDENDNFEFHFDDISGFEAISDDESFDSVPLDDDNWLFRGSTTSIDNFKTCFQAIASTFHFSASLSSVMLDFISAILPPGNKCKSLKKTLIDSPEVVEAYQEHKSSNKDGVFYALRVADQLSEIVRRTSSKLRLNNFEEHQGTIKDLKLPRRVDEPHHRSLNLIINSDGVPLVKSYNLELWPIWVSIAELPPIQRSSFKNIALLGLWTGRCKPDWSLVWSAVKGELDSIRVLGISFGTFTYHFFPLILVADMPAKASLLRMKQFNGYFGCTLCMMEGSRKSSRHLYPTDELIKMRSRDDFIRHSLEAEVTDDFIFGIRGRTDIHTLFPEMPLSAPIDYMHQVFLGVVRSLLSSYKAMLTPTQRDNLDSKITSVRLPIEINNRQPRSLRELKYWKATELKVFLMHIGPVVLGSFLAREYFEHFLSLAFAIKLLSSDHITQNDRRCAASLLKYFNENVVKLFGETQQTYNIHSLRHLIWQTQKFGPLWCLSAFSFESANHMLKLSLTGTVNHGEILVKRFISRRQVFNNKIAEDGISSFTAKLIHRSIEIFHPEKFVAVPLNVRNLITEQFPSGEYRVEGRYRFGRFSIHSQSYCRRRSYHDSFVMFRHVGGTAFGEVCVFVKPASEARFALVSVLTVTPIDFSVGDTNVSDFFVKKMPSVNRLVWVPVSAFIRKCCIFNVTGEEGVLSVITEEFEHD